MATGSVEGSSDAARIFLVTNIPPSYGNERGLRNCFRGYSGQEGPQIEYSKLKSPDNSTEAALVTIEGLSSDGAHDVLQQKMLLGGRTLNINHVCSESVTLHFSDVDVHLSQTMQRIAARMGLHFTTKRKELCVLGPFDLVQQFRMDVRAEVFLAAHCSSYTPVVSGTTQSVQSTASTPRRVPQIRIDASEETQYHSMRSNEVPSEQQKATDTEASPFLNQKTVENDTHILIDNLSPDVLQLLDKIPEGDIPGVQYNPSLGTVTIQGLNKADVEETTAKFEAIYESILAPGPSQFQVDIVQLDDETDINAVLSLVNELNHQYVRCTFVHSEDTQMIKILSNSTEQMEQAKKQLLEQLKQPDTITTTPDGPSELTEGGAPAKRSVEVFSTKLKSGHTITIKKGDITKENAAVLVSMINDRFQCIGEMAHVINAASKGTVQQRVQDHAKNQRSFVNAGDLVVTRGGGTLKYKKVYHVVCPDLTDSANAAEVEVTIYGLVTKVLLEAERQKARTIVLPSFVSAVFSDVEMVAKAVTQTVVDYCYHHAPSNHKQPVVSNITIVVRDDSLYDSYVRNLTQKKSGGKTTDVKPAENSTNQHYTTPVIDHVLAEPNSDGTGETPSVSEVSPPNRPGPEPPVVAVPIVTRMSSAENVSLTKYRSLTTISPTVSRKPPPAKKDEQLYQRPTSPPMNSRPSDVLATMDENCPVCGGTFTTPTAGKCGHSFCSQCLNDAMQDDAPLCPVCKEALEGIQPPICPLCSKKVMEAVTATCCRQVFCRACLSEHLKHYSQCPICKCSFGGTQKTAQPQTQQTQPSGTMKIACLTSALPGYTGCDTIQITYDVPNGIDANGQPYVGANRVAYLPDNIEGREILKLLQKAWKDGLIYYISPKSEVVWTDIPHKINTTGGQLNRGYPDPQYFYNVRQSLASKGIVPQ